MWRRRRRRSYRPGAAPTAPARVEAGPGSSDWRELLSPHRPLVPRYDDEDALILELAPEHVVLPWCEHQALLYNPVARLRPGRRRGKRRVDGRALCRPGLDSLDGDGGRLRAGTAGI